MIDNKVPEWIFDYLISSACFSVLPVIYIISPEDLSVCLFAITYLTLILLEFLMFLHQHSLSLVLDWVYYLMVMIKIVYVHQRVDTAERHIKVNIRVIQLCELGVLCGSDVVLVRTVYFKAIWVFWLILLCLWTGPVTGVLVQLEKTSLEGKGVDMVYLYQLPLQTAMATNENGLGGAIELILFVYRVIEFLLPRVIPVIIEVFLARLHTILSRLYLDPLLFFVLIISLERQPIEMLHLGLILFLDEHPLPLLL